MKNGGRVYSQRDAVGTYAILLGWPGCKPGQGDLLMLGVPSADLEQCLQKCREVYGAERIKFMEARLEEVQSG